MSGRGADVDPLREYYARRAASYDRIYLKPARQAELRALEAELARWFAGRRVLELACGTGWWTPHGARDSADWLATDINPGTMALAMRRELPKAVRFAQLDAWTFDGLEAARFDAAFAGCWWSHVPRARLPGWLDALHARLPAGARVVFIDNRYVEGDSTPIARRDADGNGYQRRTLDDGSVHEVLKNHPSFAEAAAALGPRARALQWSEHPHYWRLAYELG